MQKIANSSLVIILGLIACGLIYLLSPILTPFLVAALIAYLGDPLVSKFSRLGLPHLLSAILVFTLLFGAIIFGIILIVPLIEKQIEMLFGLIPYGVEWIQNTVVPWLQIHFGINETINAAMVKETLAENWQKAGSLASWAIQKTFESSRTLILWMTNLLLIPVVTFYLLRDWQDLLKNLRSLLPRRIEPTTVKLVKDCDSVLSAFFRGQFLVMLSLAIIYSAGLMIVGLNVGLVIGVISGLLCIVPYLGFITGIVAATIAALIQFGNWNEVFFVWGVFAIGQATESMILTPKLVGDRIGLHPVAVIFSVLCGATLFGFFGVLLALPGAAVIMVWLRFLTGRYRESKLYQS